MGPSGQVSDLGEGSDPDFRFQTPDPGQGTLDVWAVWQASFRPPEAMPRRNKPLHTKCQPRARGGGKWT